ncbi:MAG TPA: aldo/keto reductase [Desulfobacteraceae bacterium]|nr:aldo/keto reductase [Desulfobacteraceae bacterium]|tara:strand:- start:50 stop:1267 length:1218 start_codon:yes stop_codon:yes gene_type:complete
MTTEKSGIKRRQFLQILGAAGIGSVVGSVASPGSGNAAAMTVGTRDFGRTGVQVPILSLGTMFDTGANQLLLRQAVKWGVTYWDTAQYYNRWGSEHGIGKYLAKYPGDRKKIFLVSKSTRRDVNGLTSELNDSLNNLKTDYLDLFFIHAVDDAKDDMTPEIKAWSEKMKSEGKIRLFGFSTHSNMAACLSHAATLGWIDGIMTTYNYKVMNTDDMKRAVDACHNAGIGLTAMKTQAASSWLGTGGGGSEGRTLAKRFTDKGMTEEQAKILAVWTDERISSVCSQMNTMAILKANTQAAVNQVRLTAADQSVFEAQARATADQYCAGCTAACESGLTPSVPVGKVMRCLMYARSYGDHFRAHVEFNDIPFPVREQLARLDYSDAERRCPRNMPIARLMAEAAQELS